MEATMKKYIVLAVVLIAAVFEISVAKASQDQFIGMWRNVDEITKGITRLKISIQAQEFLLQAWKKCTPADCDLGKVIARPYGRSEDSILPGETISLTAQFKTQKGKQFLTMLPDKSTTLRVNSFCEFKGHKYLVKEYIFVKDRSSTRNASIPKPAKVLLPSKVKYSPLALETRNKLPPWCIELTSLDGETRHKTCKNSILYMEAPLDEPPEPGFSYEEWLYKHNILLLEILASNFTAESIETYLGWEENNGIIGTLEQIEYRVKIFDRRAQ
jgi:hypothetical protein